MEDFWLCASAFAAGAVNSVAGGGTLLTFPALDFALGGTAHAAVLANGTSTVVVLPGSLGGAWGYRREFVGTGRWIRLLIGPSIIGGILGAWLLVAMPPETFKQLVPWLILAATLLFLLQPWIAKRTGIGVAHAEPHGATVWGIAAFQLVVATYGGYFGAGIGILMLASMAMMGMADIHRMNALKSLLGSTINGVAAALFIYQGTVAWRYAIPMMVAATIGGVAGASIARRMDRTLIRRMVIIVGFTLTTYYLLRTYMPGVLAAR